MIKPVQTYPKVSAYSYPMVSLQNQIPNRDNGTPIALPPQYPVQTPLSGLIRPPQLPTAPTPPPPNSVPPLSGIILPQPGPTVPQPPVNVPLLPGIIYPPFLFPKKTEPDTPLAGKVAIPPKTPDTKQTVK